MEPRLAMAGYNMSAGFEEVPQPGAVRCPHQLDADEVNRLNLAAIERLDRTDGCILSDRVGFIAVRRWRVGPLGRSEEHTSELQSQSNLVCRLLPEQKNN